MDRGWCTCGPEPGGRSGPCPEHDRERTVEERLDALERTARAARSYLTYPTPDSFRELIVAILKTGKEKL